MLFFNCLFSNDYHRFLDEIVDRITKPRIMFAGNNFANYPDIGDWAQKAWLELRREEKRAIVSILNGNLCGMIIYQRHKKNPDWLELKHLSVAKLAGGRLFASFLLRQAEIEGVREFDSRKIVCDTKASQTEINAFLVKNNYRLAERTDLYRLKSGLDFIWSKDANRLRQREKLNSIITEL